MYIQLESCRGMSVRIEPLAAVIPAFPLCGKAPKTHRAFNKAMYTMDYFVWSDSIAYCYHHGWQPKYVIVYAFNIENIHRTKEEVDTLINFMQEKLEVLIEKESLVRQYGILVPFKHLMMPVLQYHKVYRFLQQKQRKLKRLSAHSN
eukprot:Gb_10395 [translate_table: standard]